MAGGAVVVRVVPGAGRVLGLLAGLAGRVVRHLLRRAFLGQLVGFLPFHADERIGHAALEPPHHATRVLSLHHKAASARDAQYESVRVQIHLSPGVTPNGGRQTRFGWTLRNPWWASGCSLLCPACRADASP